MHNVLFHFQRKEILFFLHLYIFGDTGVSTHGLMLAMQASFHLSHSASPQKNFKISIFPYRFSLKQAKKRRNPHPVCEKIALSLSVKEKQYNEEAEVKQHKMSLRALHMEIKTARRQLKQVN